MNSEPLKQKYYKAALISAIGLLVLHCASTFYYQQPQFPYSQSPMAYLHEYDVQSPLVSEVYQQHLCQEFREHYFHPWTAAGPAHTADAAYWAVDFVQSRIGFGENKLPHARQWISALIDNANVSAYGDSVYAGMNIIRTSLRVLPTARPFYDHFEKAGEGFPFDYLQNSALPVNTPVRVVNESRDKAWLLVESHQAMGWVPAPQIAAVDSNLMQSWMDASFAAPISEPVSLLDSLGHYITQARVGALFPLLDAASSHWTVGLMTRKNGRGNMISVKIQIDQAVLQPWVLTLNHTSCLADLFLGQPYGWGGLFNNRDCSAMLKDFFTPFGIWLPRNSRAQAGHFAWQEEMAYFKNDKKEKVIASKGMPYLSLVYKPGHIMLYAGQKQQRPMMFHNLWGLKVQPRFKPEGRHIVGQAVISTLTPGRDLHAAGRKVGLSDGITKMTHVVHPDSVHIKSICQSD